MVPSCQNSRERIALLAPESSDVPTCMHSVPLLRSSGDLRRTFCICSVPYCLLCSLGMLQKSCSTAKQETKLTFHTLSTKAKYCQERSESSPERLNDLTAQRRPWKDVLLVNHPGWPCLLLPVTAGSP